MWFRRIVTAMIVAGGVVATGLHAGTAAASASGAITSAGQAGYSATSARFDFVGTWARLPDASRFARQVGSVTVSVQLWTSHSVLDLTATACTDASCRPGGRPQKRKYRLQFAVYSRSTGMLVCSSSSSGRQRCPGMPRSWNRARLAPGRVVNLALSYPVPHDLVFVYANNQMFVHQVSTDTVFHQARIVAEFGAGPFGKARFRAPAAPVPVVSFGIPPAPPFFAEIATGRASSCFTNSHWARRRVQMTAASGSRRQARPGSLSYHGCNFTVYLEPRS